MKKSRLEKTFLNELEKVPNISLAAERVGLSRQTIYRWKDEDKKFAEKIQKKLGLGVESINDLAESKLISKIKVGDMKAVQYWLNNNKKNYMRPRPKNFWENVMNPKVTSVNWKVVSGEEKDNEVEVSVKRCNKKNRN